MHKISYGLEYKCIHFQVKKGEYWQQEISSILVDWKWVSTAVINIC